MSGSDDKPEGETQPVSPETAALMPAAEPLSVETASLREAPPAPFHHEGGNMPVHSHHDDEVKTEVQIHEYWKANLRLLASLLAVWLLVSFGAGIVFADALNAIKIGGYPLGFWFAQQGSIFVFVGLIFYYTHRMKVIERRFGIDDDEEISS